MKKETKVEHKQTEHCTEYLTSQSVTYVLT